MQNINKFWLFGYFEEEDGLGNCQPIGEGGLADLIDTYDNFEDASEIDDGGLAPENAAFHHYEIVNIETGQRWWFDNMLVDPEWSESEPMGFSPLLPKS